MEIFKDLKFWGIALTVLLQCTTVFALIVMKFNDLKHLGEDVGELKIDVKKIDEDIDDLNKRVSNIEGKLSK